MPRFVAVYTIKSEDIAAFRARPSTEQAAIDATGLKAWEAWRTRNATCIVGTDVMVGRTRRVTRGGATEARNPIAGFVMVEATDLGAAADLFLDHPHITVFPGDGIDVMPVVSDPPEQETP